MGSPLPCLGLRWVIVEKPCNVRRAKSWKKLGTCILSYIVQWLDLYLQADIETKSMPPDLSDQEVSSEWNSGTT